MGWRLGEVWGPRKAERVLGCSKGVKSSHCLSSDSPLLPTHLHTPFILIATMSRESERDMVMAMQSY